MCCCNRLDDPDTRSTYMRLRLFCDRLENVGGGPAGLARDAADIIVLGLGSLTAAWELDGLYRDSVAEHIDGGLRARKSAAADLGPAHTDRAALAKEQLLEPVGVRGTAEHLDPHAGASLLHHGLQQRDIERSGLAKKVGRRGEIFAGHVVYVRREQVQRFGLLTSRRSEQVQRFALLTRRRVELGENDAQDVR